MVALPPLVLLVEKSTAPPLQQDAAARQVQVPLPSELATLTVLKPPWVEAGHGTLAALVVASGEVVGADDRQVLA